MTALARIPNADKDSRRFWLLPLMVSAIHNFRSNITFIGPALR